MAVSQTNTVTFQCDGNDIDPNLDPETGAVILWRVPSLGMHRCATKSNAKRALKIKLQPEMMKINTILRGMQLNSEIERQREALQDAPTTLVVTHNGGNLMLNQHPVVHEVLGVEALAMPDNVTSEKRGNRTFTPLSAEAIADIKRRAKQTRG